MEEEDRYAAHGHVTITDAETGEILADKDNMIVKTGRDIIAKAIFGGSTISIASFSMFFENDDSSETKPDMKYASISDHLISGVNPTIVSKISDADITSKDLTSDSLKSTNLDAAKTNVLGYLDTTGTPQCNLAYVFTSTTNYYVTALGLLYADSALFSRVMFDPIYMRSTRKYIVKYVIKF